MIQSFMEQNQAAPFPVGLGIKVKRKLYRRHVGLQKYQD